jgi:hypothetical protein
VNEGCFFCGCDSITYNCGGEKQKESFKQLRANREGFGLELDSYPIPYDKKIDSDELELLISVPELGDDLITVPLRIVKRFPIVQDITYEKDIEVLGNGPREIKVRDASSLYEAD